MIPAKAITYSQPSPWIRAHSREDFDVCGCPAGSRVLDVGCGYGKNLEKLKARGMDAVGIDPEIDAVEYCLSLGLQAQIGSAERLEFPDSSFDAVILDGVIQFTDPQKALAEALRVIGPGGKLRLTTQGLGYALYLMLLRRGVGRLFGARMFLSTPWFALTRRRIGDTTCFSRRQVAALCERAGFRVDRTLEGRRHFGLPVFAYLEAHKP